MYVVVESSSGCAQIVSERGTTEREPEMSVEEHVIRNFSVNHLPTV